MLASIMIDWITFTVLCCGNDWGYVVRHFLRLNPDLFQSVGYGRYGYASSVEFAGIRVLYDGRCVEDDEQNEKYLMGVCVSLSGDACRAFEEMNPGYQIIDLIKYILSFDTSDARISRLDIACDDKAGRLNMDTIIHHATSDKGKDHYINSRMNNIDVHDSRKKGSNKAFGKTVYFGAPSSEKRIRIYDKAKEQGDYDSHWVRFELVLHREYAMGAARELVAAGGDIGACVAGMIRQCIEFINPDDSNVSRCTVAEWWDIFLCAVEAVRFYTTVKVAQNADKLESWFINQLGRCVAMAHKMFGSAFFDELARDGSRRMTKSQWAVVQDYFDRFGIAAEVHGQLNMFA